ncbi:hypothetical protein HY988_06535 [Candidatus Micrarchaeota archaeon]|nr:hypothetical protein [Candidatus Micrarchaeota archaeon]
MAGQLVSLTERIAGSRKAQAVERAWRVAKEHEGNRPKISGLAWVEPAQTEKGPSRRVDFAKEFPEGVDVLMPVPMSISVVAPANVLVPNENMNFTWTMPILTRLNPTQELPHEVKLEIGGFLGNPRPRPGIEVVTFLPFPKADAPVEEMFAPEFYISLGIDPKQLGSGDSYFTAVVRVGGKIISQFVTSDRSSVIVLADPYHSTLFKSEMLMNLNAEELARTPENAGKLEIYLYRITKGETRKKIAFDATIYDFGSGECGLSPTISSRGLDPSPMRRAGLTSIAGDGQRPTVSDPASVAAEVGETRVSAGTAREAVNYSTLEGYGFDGGFLVQPITIRCLGVRERSGEATLAALERIGVETA